MRLSPDILEILEELSKRTGVRNVSDLLRFSVKEVGTVLSGEPTLVPNAPPRKRMIHVPGSHVLAPEHMRKGQPGVRFRPSRQSLGS